MSFTLKIIVGFLFLYIIYLYLTINTCSTLSLFAFIISELNNYLEWPIIFSYKIPISENVINCNCPYVWRNTSFSYDEPQLEKCMNSNCLEAYHGNSTKKYFWCAVRFVSNTSCPMTIFQLDNKAYEIDPRFYGNSGHSLAMRILTNLTQDGLLLMTSGKYITPFHSAATVTHHLLLRGTKIWCFLHSQARSTLKINGYTDIPVYSSLDIYELFQNQPFNCIKQNVGDIIFLPSFVYHFVYSFENTVALTTHHTNDIVHAVRSYLFDTLYRKSKVMKFISDDDRDLQIQVFENYLLNKINS